MNPENNLTTYALNTFGKLIQKNITSYNCLLLGYKVVEVSADNYTVSLLVQ